MIPRPLLLKSFEHALHQKLRRLLPRPFRRGEWGEGLPGVVYPAVLSVALCAWFTSIHVLPAAEVAELPKSLFISISALEKLPDAQIRDWFEHIVACHRVPGTPQRIDSLVLTGIAIADPADPDGTSALLLASPPPGMGPKGYHPSRHQLDIVSQYFKYFDSIYVGTMNLRWHGTGTAYTAGIQDADFRRRNIRFSTNIMDRFIATYPKLKFRWYISYEANLNYFTNPKIKDAYVAYNLELGNQMKARRNVDILWSPNFWTRYDSLSDTNRATLIANLKDHFSRVPITELHFQDHRGGSSALALSRRFTVDDTKHYYDLLAGLDGPSVRVNVEMFVRDEHTGRGAAPMKQADYVQRMTDYAKAHLPLGASWEIRHWYAAHQDATTCTTTKRPSEHKP